MSVEDFEVVQEQARLRRKLYELGEVTGANLAYWGKEMRTTFERAGRAGAGPISPKTLSRVADVMNQLRDELGELLAEITAYQKTLEG